MIRDPADRRFANVDERTRVRIVVAYRDHCLSMALLVERFQLSAGTLQRVLSDAGVPKRKRGSSGAATQL